MNTQHHEIEIHAPREAVWRAMLHSPGYEQWTAAFCEGSRYEGSWEAGTPIRFLGPDGGGSREPWGADALRTSGATEEGGSLPAKWRIVVCALLWSIKRVESALGSQPTIMMRFPAWDKAAIVF